MKLISRFKYIVVFCLFPVLTTTIWAQDLKGVNEDKAKMCRYGADHMIQFATQSLSEPTSRPERVEKRRKLVENWSSRLRKGEDPCFVYTDIQKAAATF